MTTTEPCSDMHLLVQAELDGELDAAGAAGLAAHIARCPACAALREELGELSATLRGGLTRYAAPPGLRKVIGHEPRPERPVRRRSVWGYGGSFAAGLAVAAAVAMFVVLPGDGSLTPDVVGAHIRALQPGHLVDIGSSDQHTVKPWFDGRLDYAPTVQDFTAEGFPLIGARLDYVGERPVAALVYGRAKHLIDLFEWPGDTASGRATVQGYHVIGWTQAGMNFRAVSDLNFGELGDLVRLLRGGGK